LCTAKPFVTNSLKLLFICTQYIDSGSGGQISWDQNSTFSGGRIFDHEVKIQFVHEVEFVH
jgi:hypothetical protein